MNSAERNDTIINLASAGTKKKGNVAAEKEKKKKKKGEREQVAPGLVEGDTIGAADAFVGYFSVLKHAGLKIEKKKRKGERNKQQLLLIHEEAHPS